MSSSVVKFGRLCTGRVLRVTSVGVNKVPIANIRVRTNRFHPYVKMVAADSRDYWLVT